MRRESALLPFPPSGAGPALDDALSSYAEALAGFTAAGNEYEAACCLAATASIRLTQNVPGDSEAAQAMKVEAEHIFERLRAV